MICNTSATLYVILVEDEIVIQHNYNIPVITVRRKKSLKKGVWISVGHEYVYVQF